MVGNFHLPPMGFGPGSQPPEEDGKELEYMAMPQDMRAYSAHIPDIGDNADLRPALDMLGEIAAASASVAIGKGGKSSFDLSGLDPANRALIAETMGEGEVSVRLHGVPAIAAQESVFAGIWILKGAGIDMVEVGPVPALATDRAFVAREPATGGLTPKEPGVLNAPSLLVELMDKSATWSKENEPHIVNLTLLPHTEQDLDWLETALGTGSVEFLSRGYGNCRVDATGQANVWRVRFYNSMDTLILDTYEVTDIPEVVVAAREDLADSSERLLEVIEAIR